MTSPMEDYHCPRCPFKSILNCRMQNHLTSHDFPKEQKPFNCASALESLKCFQCTNFETHSLAHLKHHFKSDHTLLKFEAELYSCEHCSFQTYSNYLFLRHKLFKVCKKSGKIKSEPMEGAGKLRHVLEKHSQDMPDRIKRFRCDQCPFKTAHNKCLKVHVLRKHSEDRAEEIKRFQCDQCPYKTAVTTNLKVHVLRKHSGDIKRFQCDLCPYKTVVKSSLTRHILGKHPDRFKMIKQFQCAQYSYRTELRSNVKCHNTISQHSQPEKIQWFQCGQCPYKFTVEAYLKRHVEITHSKVQTLNAID